MNESEETEEKKLSPSILTCCKDSRPCPTVSQYQLDAPVTQDTLHLCLIQPPPHRSTSDEYTQHVFEEKRKISMHFGGKRVFGKPTLMSTHNIPFL